MKTHLTFLFLAGLMIPSLALAQDASSPATPPSESLPGGTRVSIGGTGGGGVLRGRGTAVTQQFSGARGGPNANDKSLDQNVTIHIKGIIAKDTPVDISFTGCGPTFSLSKVIAEVPVNGNNQPIIATCEISITPVEGAYRIQYSVGCRVPTVTSSTTSLGSVSGRAGSAGGSTSATGGGQDTTDTSSGTTGGGRSAVAPRNVTSTVTYTSVSSSSTVILKMGQTITASSSDDQGLTISLTNPTP